MILRPGIHVFHGSYMEIRTPELNKCRPKKDFGRGFYVTTSREQAVRFTKTSVKKALYDGIIDVDNAKGILNEYALLIDDSITSYEFKDADIEWLHCVVAHRRSGLFSNETEKWKNYDVIAGKIANDNTNLVITAYIDGVYGEAGTEKADNIAIGFLEPENLANQICLRTPGALRCLEFVNSMEVKA